MDGNGRKSARSQSAFTFLELIIVVAVFIAMLALVALPALARPKSRSAATGCLSNLRQLMSGWQMYADDNRGRLMLNALRGTSANKGWVGGSSDFTQTNVAIMLVGLMGKYVNSNATVYRCPGDVVPGPYGVHARSYSMNGQLGPQPNGQNTGAPLRLYSKETDITCPTPANLFVFCDEHPGTLDDGYLGVSGSNPSFPNVPASYVENGCGFSFADGHGELHKWEGTALLIPVVESMILSTPTVSATDPDWIWFHGKAGCP